MSEQQRWTIFIVISFSIILYYSLNNAKEMEKARAAEKLRQEELAAQMALEHPEGAGVATDEAAFFDDSPTTPGSPTVADDKAAQVVAWKSAREETIRTKSLLVRLGAYGGRVESWKIIDSQYSVALRGQDVTALSLSELDAGGEEMVTPFEGVEGVPRRPLELSLVGTARSFVELNRTLWTVAQAPGAEGAVVATLTSPALRGIQVVKRLEFPAEGFEVKLSVDVRNVDEQAIRFANEDRGMGLSLGPATGAFQHFKSYLDVSNALYYDQKIHVIPGDLEEHRVKGDGGVLWIGVQNQYFLSALLNPVGTSTFASARTFIPPSYQPDQWRGFDKRATHPIVLETFTAPFTLAAGASQTFAYELFVGPKARGVLKQVGADVHLPRAVFYASWDWFRALCLGMMWMLDLFHGIVGSWGLSIILLTVTVKIITHPINHRALRVNAEFQQKMAKFKPEMDAINVKYKDDLRGKQQAQMALYKAHGLNPLAPLRGCLPMFIQFPIFVALYRIFSDYIVLRGSSFLWIHNLADSDKLVPHLFGTGFDLNILPLLMVATQILSMRMTSKNVDPSQKMMFYIMPLMMLFFFYSLPAGLFLYWTMQNVWQIGHTLITNKEVQHEAEVEEASHHHGHGGPAASAGSASGPRGSVAVVPAAGQQLKTNIRPGKKKKG